MSGALQRVRRVREIQEELCRAELAVEQARLRELDHGYDNANREAEASRKRWFARVAGEPAGEPDGELSSEATGANLAGRDSSAGRPGQAQEGDLQPTISTANQVANEEGGRRTQEQSIWELAIRQRDWAERLLPGQQARVDEAQAGFLAGRRDRLQVEALVEAAAAAEDRERTRREQRELDEWFQRRRDGKRKILSSSQDHRSFLP